MNTPQKVRTLPHCLGQKATEPPEYNLHGLLRALVDPAARSGGFELEVSQELAGQVGRGPQGVYVPVAALARALNPQRRDLVVATPSAGGYTVATDLRADMMIGLLRNRSVVIDAGAIVLTGLVGAVSIPRQTGAATAYWVAENGSPTESAAAFDQVPLSPKTIGAFTDMSRKMVLQSSLDISSFVASDLAAAIGLGIDAAALNGSGSSNEPTGIFNQSGVQTLALSGAAPTWEDIVALETLVAQENADLLGARMGYAVPPSLAGKLRQTPKVPTYGEEFILTGPRSAQVMNGNPVHVSNQLPHASATTQHLIFGNWADLVVGQWGVLDIMVDPYTHSTSGALRIVAMQDVDIAVRHPKSFAVVTDAGLS